STASRSTSIARRSSKLRRSQSGRPCCSSSALAMPVRRKRRNVSIVGWIMIIPSCLGWRSIGAASSVVVGRPPQIAVLAQAVLGVGIEKRVPPVGLEQPLDIARGGDAGGERAFAGEFEPFLTVGAGQPQYAETGAHRLLGMLARAEQTVDIGADGKPEGGGLGAQLVRGSLGHRLVCRRHVLARGGVVRLGGAARMTGDPLALVE